MVGRAPTPAPIAATSPSAAALPQPPLPPARASVLAREGKKSGSALPLAIAAALVLVLAGGAYAFRAPLGAFVAGFGAGFTGDKAYEQGKVAGAASNPVGATQAATVDAVPPPVISAPATPAVPTSTAAMVASDAAPSTPGVQPVAPIAASAPPPVASVATDTQPAQVDATSMAANDAPSSVAPGIKRLLAAKRAGRDIATTTPPREVAAPRTPRIAVITIGDDAITGPARQRIEERLMDAGFDVVDSSVIGGVEGRRDLPGIFNALRRDATVAVVVRADAIGSQTLTYYGQSSELFSVNLSVRSYLVGTRQPLGAGFKEKVDFTTLNANEKAEESIDPRLDRLLGDLSPYRRGRG
jgi:serine/threonine-protein kinase